MEENKKSKSGIVLKVLYIVAPLLMVFTVVILIYAWYTNTLQTGELDVTTKNFTIEYTFDEDTEKNVSTYTVDDLSFFDYDATEEVQFLPGQAKELLINLTNTSESDMNYTITFKATKTITTGTNDTVESVAYIGALLDFTGMTGATPTYSSISARYAADTTHTNYTGAAYDATSATTIAATNYLEVKTTGSLSAKDSTQQNQTTNKTSITLNLFGIQEIDSAINSQFIYQTENNVTSLRSYTFEITIYAEPISSSTVEENTNN